MDKNKRFLTVILLLISLVIVILLSMLLLDTTGKINQGHFRISDLVVSSTVVVEDKKKSIDETEVERSVETTDQTINSLSDLLLDVSQKNEIMFLITTEGTKASQMYIDNVKIDYPNLAENMFIYQNSENMINLKTNDIRIDLVKEDKESQYLVKLNVDNINCIKDAAIEDSELSSVKFDGTIFNLLNRDISDFMFELSFNFNIIDSIGKSNISKINLKLPNKLLATNGISIISEDVGKFPFTVK